MICDAELAAEYEHDCWREETEWELVTITYACGHQRTISQPVGEDWTESLRRNCWAYQEAAGEFCDPFEDGR